MGEYKVVCQSFLGECAVLTLDRKRAVDDYGTRIIISDGKEYSYYLTHNEFLICVKTTDDLLGKTISFKRV